MNQEVVLYGPTGRPIIEGQERSSLTEVQAAFLKGLPVRSSSPVSMETAYQIQTFVYACVSAVSRIVACIPFDLKKRDKSGKPIGQALYEHPLADRLRRPSPRRTWYDLAYARKAHLELSGNAYWYLEGEYVPGKTKAPDSIKPLLPSLIEHVRDYETGETLAYKYRQTPQSSPIPIPRDKVMHFRYFNPLDNEIGLSPLQAAMMAVRTDVKAAIFNEKVFDNSAQPAGLLLHRRPLSKIQMEQVRTAFEEEYGGYKQSHRTAVLSGDWSWQQLGLAQADMEYLAQRRFSREQICAVFGVPGLLVNDPNNSNYSTAHVEMRLFAETNWLPKLRYCEQIDNQQLVRLYAPELIGSYDLREAPGLREEIDVRIERAKTMHQMGMPLEDVMKWLELPFGPYPWAKDWWIPISMVPADKTRAQGMMDVQTDKTLVAQPSADTQNRPPRGPQKEPTKKPAEAPPTIVPPEKKAAGAPGVKQREIYWRGMDALKRHLANQIANAFRRYLGVAQQYALRGDFEPDAQRRLIQQFVAPQMCVVLESGGRTVIDELGLDVNYTIDDCADEHVRFVLDELSSVVDRVRRFIEEGKKTRPIIDRFFLLLDESVPELSRAYTARLFSESRIVAMRQMGAESHQWISARGVYCGHLSDGEVRSIGEPFSHGLSVPGQSTDAGEPCGCVTIPVP